MAKTIKTWSTPVLSEKKRLIPCAICGSLAYKPALSCEGFSYVRCVSCGLVQMNPQPLEEEIRHRYNADYLNYELANEKAFLNLQLLALEDAGFGNLEKDLLKREKRQENEPASGERPGALPRAVPRVLDIGCATGSLLAHLREKGWETTGVEISLPQAEYAGTKRGLDVRSLPLQENHFPAAHFNAVLASHLIEHLNDPAGLVQEVNRILTPGGCFFVTTPNITGFQARLFGSRWRSAIFDHLYLFSKRTLSGLLRDKGFTVEKTATWGGLAAGTVPAPIKRIFDKAAKRFGFGDVMIIKAAKK